MAFHGGRDRVLVPHVAFDHAQLRLVQHLQRRTQRKPLSASGRLSPSKAVAKSKPTAKHPTPPSLSPSNQRPTPREHPPRPHHRHAHTPLAPGARAAAQTQ
jgi:hypothetical protein